MNGTVYVEVGPKADGTFCFHNFKSFGDATIIHPADRKKLRLKAERERGSRSSKRLGDTGFIKGPFDFPLARFSAVLLAVMNQLRHFKLRQQRQSEGGGTH